MKQFIKYLGVLVLVAGLFAGSVYAGTQDKTLGGTIGYPARMSGKMFLLERTLDFSSSAHTGTAADVYEMIYVPTGSWVMAVGYEIETGEDSTCTIDVGDGDDADGYFNDANVETNQTLNALSRWTYGSTAVSAVTNVYQLQYTLNVCTGITVQSAGIGVGGTNGVTNVTANTVSVPVGTNLTVTSYTIYPTTTAPRPYAAGRFYATGDTLDMTLNNDADALKITVRAIVAPIAGVD